MKRIYKSELMDVQMIDQIDGEIQGGKMQDRRKFSEKNNYDQMDEMVGGGLRERKGEVQIENNGVMFMEEFNELQKKVMD